MMSNYPDNFSDKLFESYWGADLSSSDEQSLYDAYESLNAAIGDMQQAIYYTNNALKNAIQDNKERVEWVNEVYGMLHDKIIDGHIEDIRTIEELEGITDVKLPSLQQMLHGVDKIGGSKWRLLKQNAALIAGRMIFRFGKNSITAQPGLSSLTLSQSHYYGGYYERR